LSKKDITIKFLGTCAERSLPRESPAACAQCVEAVKDSKHAFQSSLLVNNKFMLDAGWNFSKLLGEIGAKYILITHAHSDHVGAIVSEDRKIKAEIHGPKGLRSDITELYGSIGHQITEHELGKSFTLDGVKFKFVPVYHSSKVATYAIKIDDRVMYAPDFLGFIKGFELEGIELFIGDGSCLNRSIKRKNNVGHMSMIKQVQMCFEAKVKYVMFTHVGHLYTKYDESLLTLRKLTKDSKFYLNTEKVYIAKDADKFTLKADSRIIKGVGSYMKSNKPAWKISAAEEIFDVPGFKLPAQIILKVDGIRIQMHIAETVCLFLEDGTLEKRDIFKSSVVEFAEKIPEDTVLDVRGIVKDNKVVEFQVLDILFYKNKDLRDLPLSERMKYLAKIPTTKYLKPLKEGKGLVTCKTKEELFIAMKCSENVMIKTLSGAILRKSVHNKGWIKRLIEKDWCEGEGGKWITVKGKHICISADVKILRDSSKLVRVLHGKDSSTDLRWHKGVPNETAQKMAKDLQYYPIKVRNRVKSIEVFPDVLNSKTTGLHINTVSGGYINISTKSTSVEHTFHHELGHSVWKDFIRDTDFEQSYRRVAKGRTMTAYAKTSIEEDFSEHFAFFKKQPGALKGFSPKRYNLISKLMEDLERK